VSGTQRFVATSATAARISEPDITGLLFIADMYGVQFDLLRLALGISDARARALVQRWRRAGYVQTARLGPGQSWTWLTRAGLAVCGVPGPAASPALSRLAHLRAVAAVRISLESATAYRDAGAFWRSERRLRRRLGGRVGLREHVPDGEVHWPDGAAVAWAGECWAIEAELTRKTVSRTTAIMRAILTRTGDYGCPAAEAFRLGAAPRHARVLYVCSPAARPIVIRARAALGHLAPRVEIRDLPPVALPGVAAGDDSSRASAGHRYGGHGPGLPGNGHSPSHAGDGDPHRRRDGGLHPAHPGSGSRG
jgi:hypothetical protein